MSCAPGARARRVRTLARRAARSILARARRGAVGADTVSVMAPPVSQRAPGAPGPRLRAGPVAPHVHPVALLQHAPQLAGVGEAEVDAAPGADGGVDGAVDRVE